MHSSNVIVFALLLGCTNELPVDPNVTGGNKGFIDQDSDGYGPAVDCDDNDASVNPGAKETCDGIDNNCDGLVDQADPTFIDVLKSYYEDVDGDGFGNPEVTTEACVAPEGFADNGLDCDDTDPSLGAPLEWFTDRDGDGFGGERVDTACEDPGENISTGGDCDDLDPEVHPGAEDFCGDGLDSNCGEDNDLDACTEVEPLDLIGTIDCEAPAGAFTARGDQIQARYGIHGMWFDWEAESGLAMRPDGEGDWLEVTYPGTPVDQLLIQFDGRMYNVGDPLGDDTLSVECSGLVEHGDVVGAVHRYTVTDASPSPFHLTKTEVWNIGEPTMLVHFQLVGDTSIATTDFTFQRITDPDQDFAATPSSFKVTFAADHNDPLLTAVGPTTGNAVGVGRCSSDIRLGAYEGVFGSVEEGPVRSCDPDGLTADWGITVKTSGSLESSASFEFAYLVMVASDVTAVEDTWSETNEEMCGALYDDGEVTEAYAPCGSAIADR